MIPFLLVLNKKHLRAWMRKRPLKHTRLHRDYAICCVALSGDARRALCVSRYWVLSAEMLCLSFIRRDQSKTLSYQSPPRATTS